MSGFQEDKGYLAKHLIPDEPALLELDRYEDFIAARKSLIKDKFKWLIA